MLLSLVWLVFSPSRDHSPVFEGKRLEQWLDGGFEDASRALYEIGPAGVPVVFHKLQWEHPRAGYWHRYARLRSKLPVCFQTLFPRPKTVGFDELRACSALVAIGRPAVPALVCALESSSPVVRRTSLRALTALARMGARVPALPGRKQADGLQDGN